MCQIRDAVLRGMTLKNRFEKVQMEILQAQAERRFLEAKYEMLLDRQRRILELIAEERSLEIQEAL